MGLIAKPTTYATGGTVSAANLNALFDTIYDEFNGNITNANINSAAAIAWSKISKTTAALTDFPDVTITSPADGELLRYNGSAWVNATGKFKINTSYADLNAESDGATVTFNMNTSNLHTVTLGGNRTLAVSNVTVGQRFIIRLKQDGTGSRTVTWFSGINWAGGTAPTLTTTASKTDVFGFICTASGAYDGFVVGLNI